jgi:hypothetical protein
MDNGQSSDFNHEKLMDVYRSMPTAIENGALQRVAGGKEQGCDQDIWQVLDVGDGLCRILDVCYALDDNDYPKLCGEIDCADAAYLSELSGWPRSQIRAK